MLLEETGTNTPNPMQTGRGIPWMSTQPSKSIDRIRPFSTLCILFTQLSPSSLTECVLGTHSPEKQGWQTVTFTGMEWNSVVAQGFYKGHLRGLLKGGDIYS